jgi:uncharacterized protein YebE (UPF0316 family)
MIILSVSLLERTLIFRRGFSSLTWQQIDKINNMVRQLFGFFVGNYKPNCLTQAMPHGASIVRVFCWELQQELFDAPY